MRYPIMIFLTLFALFPLTAGDAYLGGTASASVTALFSDSAFTFDDLSFTAASSFELESESLFYWTTLEATEDGVSISLERLSLLLNLTDHLQLTIGRHGLLTGYGYGWNPSDLFSGAKDPTDPEGGRRGTDAAALLYDDWDSFTGKAIILLEADPMTEDISPSDISIGGEAGLLLPAVELKLTALADLPGTGEELALSAGAAAYADIAGIGIYGEINTDLDILAGCEYFFENGMSLTAEYLYHHEGLDLPGRQSFFTDLYTALLADPAYVPDYHPGYFAQHYILASLAYSTYDPSIDLVAAALYSPDSSALMLTPSASLHTAWGLTITGSYVGLVSLQADQYSELGLYPFDHAVQVGCSYAY